MTGLALETREIHRAELWQVDRGLYSKLVLKVGIDESLLRPLDVLYKLAQAQADQLQKRCRNAFPPEVGLNLEDQLLLVADNRNRELLLQRSCDQKELLTIAVEALSLLE